MDKLQKIILILVVAFLSISNPINTFAEEDIDMSFLAELLGEDFADEEVDLTSANDTYTNEAIHIAQNGDNTSETNTNEEVDPIDDTFYYQDVASNSTLETTTENVESNVLPTTGTEHILLLLLSFVMAGAIYYKKKIIK